MGEVISAEEVKASADSTDEKDGEADIETKEEKPAEQSEPTEHKAATTGDILGQADAFKGEPAATPDDTAGDNAGAAYLFWGEPR